MTYGELPEPIDHPFACKQCPYSTICCAFLSQEENPIKIPSLRENFETISSYLKPSHINYFTHWLSLINMESRYKPAIKELKDLWRLPPEKREALGKSLCFLKLAEKVKSVGNESFMHTFQSKNESGRNFIDSGLNPGNYVVVSSDKRVAIASGFISEVSSNAIMVALERDLSERYGSEIFHLDTYESQTIFMYNISSVTTLLVDDLRAKRLRELIIDRIEPEFVSKLARNVALVGAKILRRLNKVQQRAVLKALTAQDYVLIKGMPGTGKTATIVALIQLLVQLDKTVLVTSHTNAAIDNVCLRLADCGLDLLRLGSDHRIHPTLIPFSETTRTSKCRSVPELETAYNSAKVVAVTCFGAHHPLLSKRSFDFCIVDESTQVLQCSVIKALKSSKTFILIGDPDQLPPVVSNPEAVQQGMSESLFARLNSSTSTITLTLQYRMNKTITALANAVTYNGQLLCADDTVGYATLRLPKLERLQTVYNEEQWVINVLDTRIDNSVIAIDTGAVWKISSRRIDLLEELKVPVRNVQEDEERKCENLHEVSIVATIVEALVNVSILVYFVLS